MNGDAVPDAALISDGSWDIREAHRQEREWRGQPQEASGDDMDRWSVDRTADRQDSSIRTVAIPGSLM